MTKYEEAKKIIEKKEEIDLLIKEDDRMCDLSDEQFFKDSFVRKYLQWYILGQIRPRISQLKKEIDEP